MICLFLFLTVYAIFTACRLNTVMSIKSQKCFLPCACCVLLLFFLWFYSVIVSNSLGQLTLLTVWSFHCALSGDGFLTHH